MKQAELDKMLHAVITESARAHNWSYSRGFVFKATEMLFFSIIILGRVNQRNVSYSLRYKLLAFDDLFWKIVKLEENRKKPLSFRACGVWTTPMMEILGGQLPIDEWHTRNIRERADEIMLLSEGEVKKIAKGIESLDDNLALLEKLHTGFKEKYGRTVTNIWLERLLTAILDGDYRHAESIILDRIENHDSGGFQVGIDSFYKLANDYLQSMPRERHLQDHVN